MRHRQSKGFPRTVTSKYESRAPDGTYITVYRSREPVFDCWTAVLKSPEWNSSVSPGKQAMLGMSETASGFSQFTEGTEGPHMGKKVLWNEIPVVIQKHILSRITQD